jgi:putative glutamine amidotransferase
MVIGVSKLSANYGNWLTRLHNGLEIIDFYAMETAEVAAVFHSVSGLLLTGGGDVDPVMYGKGEAVHYCRDIDQRRDKLETALIELALSFGIPMLCICRGQQILNVVRKGTLFADIPALFKGAIVHQGKEDVYHTVTVVPDSLLYKITRVSGETVNSSHHQAVDIVGDDLVAAAFSPDGLTEALELKSTMQHPFCIAVQWHPERMDIGNPMSGMLGRGFIEASLSSGNR